MLVAAAVVPHPPLLVPELAGGVDAELAELRATCATAVRTVLGSTYDRLYLVGADVGVRSRTFAPWGAEVVVDVPEPLPLSLLVGGWLTHGVVRSFVAVEPDLESGECLELGADLAGSAERVALVVLGDGSARHTVKAPGYVDDRAAPWDRAVHDAFRSADVAALLAVDARLADELLAAGRAPWQVLAGAATGFSAERVQASFAAPYGVGYHVVTWT